MVKKSQGKTIWVTEQEYALLAEGKDLLTGFTKNRVSWGTYLCALNIGALSIKAINGLAIRCPECDHEVEMKMINPRKVARRRVQ